ncbi:MAG: outer membrane beta-barrel protein [Terriglobales bacterium]
MRKVIPLTVALTLVFCFAAVLATAQSASTGTVAGVVTDQSGAVVPTATVTLKDISTNATRSTTTTNAGRYVFSNVTPGVYDININKSGFAKTVVPAQSVRVGLATNVDVALRVGQASETVEVQATNTELQTLNATIGNEISGAALSSLPSLGRDVSTFVTMQPGVSPDGSVAGSVVDQSTFMLDGGNNTNDMDGSMQVYTPSYAGDPTGGVISNINGNFAAAGPTGVMPTPADSVEEFKVGTANQTADFNNSAGMQVQVVTKRGTNTYHGTVYEYYLDNNFSGNTWDNKLAGVPQPGYHYNRFGAAFGGPLISKEILGGKTYFFANYQGFRWPNSETIERIVPSTAMRNGFLTFNGTTYDMKAIDPLGIGLNPLVKNLWTLMPAGNDPSCGNLNGSRCDGINVIGFKANLPIKQTDNFGVFRLDHDFGSKWHFMSSYRYYKLQRDTDSQIDISSGSPKSLSSRPQEPWYLVAGMTTNISPRVTNDFHYSFLRNWWAWSTIGDPPQISGTTAALEPFGEEHYRVLSPYNVNTQQTRTRFWDGQDHFFRDDLTMLKGNHLFQLGGQYQHNFNWHQRTDNGGGINYYPVYLLGDSAGSGKVDLSGLGGGFPSSSSAAARMASAVLGIVTDAQQAYTRSGSNLALNPPLTPAFDKSKINYYNIYFSDSWKLRPSFTLTYGLGWTLEMPPTEENGKQVEFVDANNKPIDIEQYLNARKAAALQGQVFNPIVGYSLIGNTAGHPKYPYDPFYKSFSPRVAAAWNPDFGSDGFLSKIFGGKSTVFRGGYGRIYGRLNGVDLVLVPLLGTGLIQPVQCRNALANGTCNASVTPTASTAFRIGVNGATAPLPAASATLPQPLFPGVNDVSAAAGEALDPHFRPNVSDTFTFSVQRQLNAKMTMEVGYIGRLIHHEYQPINSNAVPYMMTLGGQSFAQAYANIQKALGCTTSIAACGASGIPANLPSQPFFEAALAGTGYCAPGTCTATVVAKELSNFTSQSVWSMWSDLDTGGTAPGFNFPRSMLNSPLSGAFGANGQISGGVGVNASVGYGRYDAGFFTLKTFDWKGVTMQSNFTWSKALGTGAYVQATSQYTAVDPFDLRQGYGVQAFDRKFVYTQFIVWQPKWYRGQQGFLGHLLGGWSVAPTFAAGSGAPIGCNLATGAGGNVNAYGGTGSQEFGAGDGENFFTSANCLFTKNPGGGSSSAHYNVNGGTDSFGNAVGTNTAGSGGAAINIFSNPVAAWNSVRAPILGFDTRTGGQGQLRGMPYWNVDIGIRKSFRITERFTAEADMVVTNLFNHNQMLDPTLDTTSPGSFGVINTQASNPRQMEFGIRVSF